MLLLIIFGIGIISTIIGIILFIFFKPKKVPSGKLPKPPSPSKPGGKPSSPSSPGGKPSAPSKPGGKPSSPSSPGGKPSSPSSPGGKPPSPSSPGGKPPSPSSPGGNPFNMQNYQYGINPQYTNELQNTKVTTDNRNKLSQPTAFWVDSINAIDGNNAPIGTPGIISEMVVQREKGNNLVTFLDTAVKQSGKPVTVVFIVYDLPGRDCAANSSNGEITADDDGLATYKKYYIDKLYNTLADTKYKNLNLVAIIEPDSLPNLVTNMGNTTCQKNAKFYIPGITYALNKLGTLNNITFYLDAAHGGWLGWKNNAIDYVGKICDNLFSQLEPNIKTKIRGFSTNTSNYQPLGVDKVGKVNIEPCKQTNGTLTCGGPDPCQLITQYNFGPNEINYIQLLDSTIKQNALCGNQDFYYITDTGRNGNPNVRTNAQDCSNWCNIRGKIGLSPTDDTALDKIDAYYWLKPPGESDGCAPSSACKRSDSKCSTGKPYQFSEAPNAGVFSPDIANSLANQN